MDVREKLVEWLCEAMILFDKRKDEKDINPFEVFADHLIAHGVTVHEWISVKDRLPDKGGCYLICQKAETWIGEVIQTARWNETEQEFRGAEAGCFMRFVTHWMPLPPAPKRETIYCKDCENLMFSDCYGECAKGHKGIVNPNDTCEHAKRKPPKGE